MAANERKKILFVASECVPFIKTGGLADVMASLPNALVKRGHDARVVIPLYKKVQGLLDQVLSATRENLTGVRVLRAFGKEETEIQSFEGKNQALVDMQKHVGHISALMNPPSCC